MRMTSAEIIARNVAPRDRRLRAAADRARARPRLRRVWDADGKRYLDFFAGVAVNNLGHCHPAVVDAITHAGCGR